MKNTAASESIRQIQEAYEIQSTINGIITYVGKTYVLIQIYGYPCVMKLQELEPFTVRDSKSYLGREVAVKVVSINLSDSNGYDIEVSHKVVSEDVLNSNNIENFEDVKVNTKYKGVIKDYVEALGVFVTLGPIDGLIHCSLLPEGFLESPCKIGDVVDVRVVQKLDEKRRISLNFTTNIQTPFEAFKGSLCPGETVVIGKVAFIERNCATLHVNYNNSIICIYVKKEDLSWERVANVEDEVFLGEEISVRYLYSEGNKLYFDYKWQFAALYPEELFSMDTHALLSTLGIDNNKFVGKITILKAAKDSASSDIKGALLSNIVGNVDSDKITLVDKYTGANIVAYMPPRYVYGLQNGAYYEVTLEAADSDQRLKEHNPYMFKAQIVSAKNLADPFKEQVECSFKENKTPKSNREAAGYLEEIGADMYTYRDRMFYELLQNADDASSARGVKVMIKIQGDYLLFSHDGLSFTRKDFRAIVSTANSTKRFDRKKTGYKGIGFKSVFTDAKQVLIKSGGFFFKFDKEAELFKDFRAFYQYVNPLYTEEQLSTFFEDNKEYESEFEGVDHLPWQLLPFWVDSVPKILEGTPFAKNYNVSIALNVGPNIEQYKELIKGIIQKPRFMLFLRNTQRIQFEDIKWDIISIAKKVDTKTNVVRLKNSFASKENEVQYIVCSGNDIPVSNEAFNSCGIPMIKEKITSLGRDKWHMYQMIEGVKIPLTSIPERIIAADTTSISYAFMLDENGQVTTIPERTPSLYAYLPMEDRRYLFPFFINADFELSSNRQEAKVSPWNEYIFYHIGHNIVSWIAGLASIKHPNYLLLLPSKYLTEELEEGKEDKLAIQFNREYKAALTTTPFILNDRGDVVLQNEVIIDDSGFSGVVGANDFCGLLKCSKRLPNPSIQWSALNNIDLFSDIEHINVGDAVEFIIKKSNRMMLLRYWCSTAKEVRNSILEHIARIPRNKKSLDAYIFDIPAFTCKGKHFSFNKLLKSTHCIIRLKCLEKVVSIIENLGIALTDETDFSHPFRCYFENQKEAYIQHVFDVIAAATETNYVRLTPSDKEKLFRQFAETQEIKIEHERICEWGIFSNRNGEIKPLKELANIDDKKYGDFIKVVAINDAEYNICPKLLDRFLMKARTQFENIVLARWSSLVGMIVDEVSACGLYQLATTTYAMMEHAKNIAFDKTIITNSAFIFAGGKMNKLSDVYINDAISIDGKVSLVVSKFTRKVVPSHTVVKAVTALPIDIKSQTLDSYIVSSDDCVLDRDEISTLLNYCIENGDTILSKHSITEKDGKYVINKLSPGQINCYSEDPKLLSFINEHCPNFILLPADFSAYKRINGVYSGDELVIKVLECIKIVDSHIQKLVGICMTYTSAVKRVFISHLSKITLNKECCTNLEHVGLQVVHLASTIEQPDDDLFVALRNKIYVAVDNLSSKLADVRLQQSVKIGEDSFPMSRLLPNEDTIAQFVDILRELLCEHIDKQFVDRLISQQQSVVSALEVFNSLNKQTIVLENAVQMAFVIKFATTTRSALVCRILDNAEQPRECNICGYWVLENTSFMKQSCTLNKKYLDLHKYLSLPIKDAQRNLSIYQRWDNYQYIKDALTDCEIADLLDSIECKVNANINITSSDVSIIRSRIGLNNSVYILSELYALNNERLPAVIEQWRKSGDEKFRSEILMSIFGVLSDSSDVVKIRKFLSNNGEYTEPKLTSLLSSATSNWISSKALILTDKQFCRVHSILLPDYYECVEDANSLLTSKRPERQYIQFTDYTLYLHDGAIPRIAILKSNNYIFHKYNEGDIVLCGDSIFVNEMEVNNLLSHIKSLVNTGGFTAEDLVGFIDQYQLMLSGSLEGEIDCDLGEDARSAASELAKQEAISWLDEHGYDTTEAVIEYSFINGVRKGNITYNIVVKSFRTKAKDLMLNPNEWLYLLKPNSKLLLYLGHVSFAVVDRSQLLGSHDFLRLRIAASNFSVEGGRIEETLERLARDTQYFERTHFVFEHLHDSILLKADSLDSYGLFRVNSADSYSSANDDDIL